MGITGIGPLGDGYPRDESAAEADLARTALLERATHAREVARETRRLSQELRALLKGSREESTAADRVEG
jgi:hypothetical protein